MQLRIKICIFFLISLDLKVEQTLPYFPDCRYHLAESKSLASQQEVSFILTGSFHKIDTLLQFSRIKRNVTLQPFYLQRLTVCLLKDLKHFKDRFYPDKMTNFPQCLCYRGRYLVFHGCNPTRMSKQDISMIFFFHFARLFALERSFFDPRIVIQQIKTTF